MWVLLDFLLWDPDSKTGPTDPFESGSNYNSDPKHWLLRFFDGIPAGKKCPPKSVTETGATQ